MVDDGGILVGGVRDLGCTLLNALFCAASSEVIQFLTMELYAMDD